MLRSCLVIRSRVVVGLTASVVILSGSRHLGAADPAPAPTPAQTQMDRDEEASESIANWLLPLADAIKDGRFEAVPDFFAPDASLGALPVPAATGRPAVPSVDVVDWTLPAGASARTVGPAKITATLRAHFARWSHFDHLLFKVKGADVRPGPPQEATVRIQEQVVATRRGAGPEEGALWWKTEVKAGPDEKHPWLITRIDPEAGTTTVAKRPFFTEVSRSTGLSVRSPRFGTQGNAGFDWHGAAAADFDGDGLLDLFVPDKDGNPHYRNRGDGSFEDVAAGVGLAAPGGGTGAVWFDFDNDGDPDLVVSRLGGTMLFENRLVPDGKAVFVDVSGPSHVGARPLHGFGVAVADIDGDGWLDIYVASYNAYGEVMPNAWFDATNGTPNLMLLNQRDGTFRDITREAGADGNRWSYAAAFADYDGDGRPDLYVANDFGPDNLYRNLGDNRFEDVAVKLGVADPGNGMGVAWGDYDNDGILDLYVMNMSSTAGNRILKRLFPDAHGVEATLFKMAAGNSLYRNKGDGTFEDVSKKAGGVGAQWAWGGGFIDIDNDGCEDLFVANGFISGKTMKDT